MRLDIAGLVLLASTCLGAPASAQSYWVDPSGIDVPPPAGGTVASPFRTIGYAVSWAVGGLVDVHLAPGLYHSGSGESFPITLPPNATIGADLPGTAWVSTEVVGSFPTAFVVPAGATFARFSGMHISGNGMAIQSVPGNGDQFVLQVIGCHVGGSWGIRLQAQACQVALEIDDSVLFGATAAVRPVADAAQIILSVSRSTFRGGMRGLDMEALNGGTITATIELSDFSVSSRCGLRTSVAAPSFIGNTVRNCVFYRCESMSIGKVASAIQDLQPAGAALQHRIDNTIFWQNDNDLPDFGPGYSVNYCLMKTPVAGTGNISGDPLLVDPAAGDLHVRPGSPVIDAGGLVPLAADRRGDPVPGAPLLAGPALFDIGQDEFYGRYVHLNPDPVSVSTSTDVHFVGPAKSLVFLVLSFSAYPAFGAGYQLGSPLAPLLLGTMPAGDTLAVTVPALNDTAVIGLKLHLQAAFLDPVGGGVEWSYDVASPRFVY